MSQPAGKTRDVVAQFALLDHTGASIDKSVFEGQWDLVFFGFTHCPEICPSAMQKAGEVLELLGEDAEKLQVLLVTVDPARAASFSRSEPSAHLRQCSECRVRQRQANRLLIER